MSSGWLAASPGLLDEVENHLGALGLMVLNGRYRTTGRAPGGGLRPLRRSG